MKRSPTRLCEIGEAPRVAGGFLEADDRLDVGQRGQDLRRDVVLVDRRIVVDHHRQIGGLGDAAKMRGRLVRLRRVDERGHHHDAVEADARGFLRHVDREGRREFGDAAQDRDAAARDRLAGLHHRDLLVLAQRTVLAHGAAHDQARHAVADQALHDARGGVDVERQVFAKLRRHGRKHATPFGFHANSPSLTIESGILPVLG